RSLTMTQINNVSQHIPPPWEGARGRTWDLELGTLNGTAHCNCELKTISCQFQSLRFTPPGKPPPFGKGRSLTFTQLNNASQHIPPPWEGARGRTWDLELGTLNGTAHCNCGLKTISCQFQSLRFAPRGKPPPFGKGRSLTFTQLNNASQHIPPPWEGARSRV